MWLIWTSIFVSEFLCSSHFNCYALNQKRFPKFCFLLKSAFSVIILSVPSSIPWVVQSRNQLDNIRCSSLLSKQRGSLESYDATNNEVTFPQCWGLLCTGPVHRCDKWCRSSNRCKTNDRLFSMVQPSALQFSDAMSWTNRELARLLQLLPLPNHCRRNVSLMRKKNYHVLLIFFESAVNFFKSN